jgi:hypothetical protein
MVNLFFVRFKCFSLAKVQKIIELHKFSGQKMPKSGSKNEKKGKKCGKVGKNDEKICVCQKNVVLLHAFFRRMV